MARKFLSVLGNTNYNETIYKLKSTCKTRYIQEALTKDICNKWGKDDEIIIFLTKEARTENWYNTVDENRRLKEILELSHPNLKIKDVEIPFGKNEDEIWDIFNIMLANIDEGDEVIFDISNSFRSIPMLVLIILNYAKALKNIQLKGIYYGAYEARTQENGQTISPVFDLTPFDSLLEWSEAVSMFLKYGNSEKIRELSTDKELIERVIKRDGAAIKIKNFVENLNDFTNNIYTCRGKMITNGKSSCKKSIAKSYQMLKENFESILEENNDLIKPLEPLFSKIDDRISEFSSDDNLKTGMSVIKWSIDNNLIQQGYTALDETIKTYLCKRYGLDDSNNYDREKIINCALNIKKESNKEEYRNSCKNLKELITQIAINWNIKKDKEKIIQIAYKIDNKLISLIDRIRDKRNDINHFGFNNSVSDYETMKNKLSKCYGEFKKYIEENSCDYKE
ncbi:TIGR02221 family CRISPR-associated protein [uncultured Clostridium sp.]|uniref:TIGR02221 family CRISPR-associated protein n=1 Tax=uncultured Clostridium sp. TaxID=59620 RepID=UPI002585014E|nr:TIGR02221 family CRISPR-associated protein [uncultured Clostridium sp.]MDU1350321.1 TIGR02221 family CRISPR-associated protein [Clostridium argentinense]